MFGADLLKGRTALISGGGTGLGKAIARSFVRYGARVAILGRREAVLAETAAELSLRPGDVLPVVCDVRFEDDVEAALARVYAELGELDILVNNAAGNFVYPTRRLRPNQFKLIIDTVLMGTVNLTLAVGKKWIDAGRRGTVLNILTTYASTGSAYVAPSACAKAGVENLTKSLGAEWGRYGIRFVGIAPGPFETEGAIQQLRLRENLIPGVDLMSVAEQRVPLGRFGKPEEVSNLATFLVSPAAEFINGEIVRIDGGEIPYMSGEFCFLDQVAEDHWDGERSRLKRA